MKTFNVFDKNDNRVPQKSLLEYTAEAPVPWTSFPFDQYDHLEKVYDQNVGSDKVYGGRNTLTHLEFRALFTPEEIRAIDSFQAKFETYTWLTEEQKNIIRTDIKEFDLATFVDITNPKYRPGLSMYVAIGILEQHRVNEVLNG